MPHKEKHDRSHSKEHKKKDKKHKHRHDKHKKRHHKSNDESDDVPIVLDVTRRDPNASRKPNATPPKVVKSLFADKPVSKSVDRPVDR